MRIALVTPAPPVGARGGNRTTALRWARLLRSLGHRVTISNRWDGRPADVLIALHALKSRACVLAFQDAHPERPVVVALTGTDLYGSLGESDEARDTVRRATRLIVLQPRAVDALPVEARARTRVICQSASAPEEIAAREGFVVCVVSALRDVKDPLLCGRAARMLPASSQIHVEHFGAPLEPALVEAAHREARENPRYRWLGDRPRRSVMRALAGSRILVLSSRLEGGANVISEALAADVPLLSTRIPGSVGLLGEDYRGYFPVGDAAALSVLLLRAEQDAQFYSSLKEQCRARRPMVDPARERASLARLLEEL